MNESFHDHSSHKNIKPEMKIYNVFLSEKVKKVSKPVYFSVNLSKIFKDRLLFKK